MYVKLIKMIRGEDKADVHPDEVENWKQYGWQILQHEAEAGEEVERKPNGKDTKRAHRIRP